jgi:fructokinase
LSDRLGIDLGGTKIEGIRLAANGEVTERIRVDTPKDDYAGTVRAIAALARRLDPIERLKVGVGTPGSWVSGKRRMQNCNSTWLNRRPLLTDLNQLLDGRVRIANDADCFALSEAHGGSGEGMTTVFGVILGTGVGGGFVVDGRLLQGPNGLAGEWGHTPLVQTESTLPSRPCYCGRENCVETFLSGPGLLATHLTLWPSEADPPVSAETIHRQADLANAAVNWWDAADRAIDPVENDTENGAQRARFTLLVWCRLLAANLARIVNTLDPDVIVLGGGLSQMREIYPPVRSMMEEHVFGEVFETELLPPRFGATSGVRGAAWLWDPDEQ